MGDGRPARESKIGVREKGRGFFFFNWNGEANRHSISPGKDLYGMFLTSPYISLSCHQIRSTILPRAERFLPS